MIRRVVPTRLIAPKPIALLDSACNLRHFLVKEEPKNKRQEAEFVPTKLVTRETTSLDQIQGELKVNSDGSLTFVEEDGIDFQPVTVQMPGGERIPLLFTVKNLVANTPPNMTSITTSTDFKGEFKVPSYRTATSWILRVGAWPLVMIQRSPFPKAKRKNWRAQCETLLTDQG